MAIVSLVGRIVMEYRPFQEEEPEVENPTSNPLTSTALNNYPVSSDGTKVRLRAVETEAEFFLKFLNVTTLRWLIWIQTISSALIILFQVILNCIYVSL